VHTDVVVLLDNCLLLINDGISIRLFNKQLAVSISFATHTSFRSHLINVQGSLNWCKFSNVSGLTRCDLIKCIIENKIKIDLNI